MALPNALETFAELSIFSDASHSRLASFFALLSNTAFHLGRKQAGEAGGRWRTSGLQYSQMAKLHLQNALRTEMQPVSSKNYKQLLMSLIAMATAAMYHEPKSMSAFLIDAERLIRLRGIPNPKKSFKTRLLHHVYTHLRIIFESLSAPKDDAEDEVSSPPLTTHGTLNAGELRKFRMSAESLNAGLDHSMLKLSDLGYNDIHLEVQGNWAQTLFPQIYGIPESLLTLLSQTICLANDKKRLDKIAASNDMLAVAINKHIKTLENNIWKWSPAAEQGLRQLHRMICEPQDGFEKDPMVKTLVSAMHDAVLIYFYRRVTNVHAMMLQDLVRKVLERLEPCMMDARDPDFATTVAWPYLIASSEAATIELQQLALRCLNSIDAQGLPFVLENATNVAQQVWQRRQQSQDFTISWLDIIAT